jgi:hypothetical protein
LTNGIVGCPERVVRGSQAARLSRVSAKGEARGTFVARDARKVPSLHGSLEVEVVAALNNPVMNGPFLTDFVMKGPFITRAPGSRWQLSGVRNGAADLYGG